MILFESDWAKYPNAIMHLSTKNKSALDLAAKLKMMGVKNHAFFLSLLDPSIADLDPFDPNLTISQMSRITIECTNNPWYVIREIARAPANSGTEPSVVELNRANICLWWCFFNHVTIILVQPRQTGKSFSTDWLMVCLMNFICRNTKINLMTKDDKLRGENIGRIKKMYDELPEYVKFRGRDDANNTEEFSVNLHKNKYLTHVPQAAEKKAYNLGRGMTTPIFHVDEGPFQSNIRIAIGAALMSMGAAIDQAKAAHEPYGVIYTTTAGKIDDKDGAFIYELVQSSALWSELMYDCKNQEDLEQTIRRHSRQRQEDLPGGPDKTKSGNYRVYAAFSYKQLGKDDNWARDQIERSTISGQDADRDIFNIWTRGSQYSPFKGDVLSRMTGGSRDPLHNTISSIGGYIVRWYIEESRLEEYLKSRSIVVGIDTSDAVGGDHIALVFTDVETGQVVGVGSYNETNLITFTRWLVWLLVTYPKLVMIIERRSSAVTIMDYLFLQLPDMGIDPFTRLFNWVMNDPLEHSDKYEEAKAALHRRNPELYIKAKRHFGFATSGSGQTSRTELYSDTLMTATKRFAEKITDIPLISQLRTLVVRNGRIDHEVGMHDDLVISWLLTHWFLTKAKNLGAYGIDVRNILKQEVIKENLTIEQAYEVTRQQEIRMRINEIADIMESNISPFLSDRLECELRALNTSLVLQENEDFSLDVFLKNIAEKKREKKYEQRRKMVSFYR